MHKAPHCLTLLYYAARSFKSKVMQGNSLSWFSGSYSFQPKKYTSQNKYRLKISVQLESSRMWDTSARVNSARYNLHGFPRGPPAALKDNYHSFPLYLPLGAAARVISRSPADRDASRHRRPVTRRLLGSESEPITLLPPPQLSIPSPAVVNWS